MLLVLSASRAEAHTVISTGGPFFGGIKHFFLSPDDVLVAVGFGILVGLRRFGVRERVVFALPVAWIISGLVALVTETTPVESWIPTACSLMAAGLFVAADRNLRAVVVVSLGALLGGLHGFLNGAAMREAGTQSALLQLAGVGVSVLMVAFYLVAVLDLMNLEKRPWLRIVARVLGSWIAATGLLLLGWSFRAGR
ncbi:MAG: HupE/UreJ family protein [Nibricoccus sp.]